MSETLLRRRVLERSDGSASSASTGLSSSSDSKEDREFATTEELLIEKLDIFLSLIEKRIERFETYFRVMSLQEEENTDEGSEKETEKEGRSRRGSLASLSLITSIRQVSWLI